MRNMMCMTGMICGPILVIWAIISGDLEKSMNFPRVSEPGFQVCCLCLKFFCFLFLFWVFRVYWCPSFCQQLVVLASCILAFFLNYTIFLNTTLNSPLTQTICGNLKVNFTICFSGNYWFQMEKNLWCSFLSIESFKRGFDADMVCIRAWRCRPIYRCLNLCLCMCTCMYKFCLMCVHVSICVLMYVYVLVFCV
jgi:hypothetical protein